MSRRMHNPAYLFRLGDMSRKQIKTKVSSKFAHDRVLMGNCRKY